MSTPTSTVSTATPTETAQTLYKLIGISLAIASGVFIGSSFVFKKKGLMDSTKKTGVAGEGHYYLKSGMWWTGMILMIIGELCNFVAYAFTQAILVTPLGALSVVLSAVLSSIFLKERLNFQGKVGCAQCIIGATIIVLHAPENKASETGIDAFEKLALSYGFLIYMSLAIVLSLILIFYMGPRYGKTNMLVYITVCSLIGSLSVVCTQGLGAAIVYSITVSNEFNRPFLYILLIFVVVTLLTEINYLNKALNLFNTSLVTPIYYVIFTSLTIVASAVLFQGFNSTVQDIVTVIAGFLVICSGILLLQTSKAEEGKAVMDSRISMFAAVPSEEQPPAGTIEPGPGELFPTPFGSIKRFSRDMTTGMNPYATKRRSKTIAMGEEQWGRRYQDAHNPGVSLCDGPGPLPQQEHKIAMRSFNGDDIGEEKSYVPYEASSQPAYPYGGASSVSGSHHGPGSAHLDPISLSSTRPNNPAATSATNLLPRHLTSSPTPQQRDPFTTPSETPVVMEDAYHQQRRAHNAGVVGVVGQYKMGLKRDEDGDTRGLRMHAAEEAGYGEDEFESEADESVRGSVGYGPSGMGSARF
ncbi:hypothetical protein BC937DRAFT_90010 [Endogone sp. FLAS-F59071]|nr:hypothetical protein BC937DRAFT_90010 [Endogone sp. FLAS-F59071]|eukprot:RUS17407.1 hypothetical protein BC937DRAFT_90010 [Endogone sp. FLAS-F59071]